MLPTRNNDRVPFLKTHMPDFIIPATRPALASAIAAAFILVGGATAILMLALSGWSGEGGMFLIIPMCLILIVPILIVFGFQLRLRPGISTAAGTLLLLSAWCLIAFLWYVSGATFVRFIAEHST
jgi:hypothetical protein